ncbi:MAG TPA: DUF433 domain-containing protein [Anaerolineaceae bacterium]|nr:DUF433 domain-containing protein [Anaerolineaceae bacterium]
MKREAERLAKRQGISLNQFILWSVAEKVGSLKSSLDDPEFPNITYRRGGAGVPAPVIKGTGIRVQTLVIAHRDWEETEAHIADQYDLPENVVREALSFYKAHKAEIDGLIQQNDLPIEPEHD